MKTIYKKISYLLVVCAICASVPVKEVEAHSGIVSAPASCGTLDSTDLKVHASNQVLNRINQASPSNGKDLFSSKVNSTTTPWTRNANIWSSKNTPVDWTGVAAYVYNNGNPNYYPSSRIGTLISPRHFLAAAHWPPNPGEQLSFIDANGNQVIRTVVAHQYLGNDLTVGVLDSDVPDTITYYPLVASSTLNSKLQTLDRSFFNVPVIGFNQTPRLVVRNLFSLSNASQQVTHFEYTTAPYSDYTQSVIGGDSGSPSFILIDGKPILLTAYTGHGSGPAHGAYINQINSAMTTLGGGYQVTQYDVSCFSNKTINYAPIPDYSEVIATSTVHQDPSTIIKTFSITDPDSDGLEFSLGALTAVSSSTFSTPGTNYFSVNNSGELTQINDLPVDTVGHSLRLTVFATDVDITPGTSTIYATINIDRMETVNILAADSVIEITYDKTVATSSIPATSDFAVTVDGSSRSVSSVSIIGNKVLLGLSSPIGSGQVVRLSYSHGVNPIKDYPSLAKSPTLDNILITNSVSGSINTNFLSGNGINGAPSQTLSIFLDSNNKLLVSDTSLINSYSSSSTVNKAFIRLNADGTIDNTFNYRGDMTAWRPAGVKQQSDGKYIISGTNISAYTSLAIERINYDGSPDNTFVGQWDFSCNSNAVVIQSDGKIISGAGCEQLYGASTQKALARILSNGNLDTTFNSGGVGLDSATNGTRVEDIVLQPDGKILVAGEFESYNGTSRLDLLRLNTDGTLDTSFSHTLPVSTIQKSISDIELLADGKMYVTVTNSATTTPALYRLNTDGSTDTSFVSKNFAKITSTSQGVNVYSAKQASDGKVVVSGNFEKYDNQFARGLVRVLPNGDIDNTFVTSSGIGSTTVGFSQYFVYTTQTMPDGNLVAIGTFATYDGVTKNNIVGILAQTTSDATSPTITSVTSPSSNGTYVVGQTIPIHVVFSEPVVLVGSSPYINLDLNLGTSTVRTATYASGSGSSTLVFNYTVQSGDSTTDLEYINAGSLIIGSGNLEDAVGNHAILTLPVPTLSGSLSANKAIVVDGIIPVPTEVYVSGGIITLLFDSTVATSSIPNSNMFTVKVNGSSGLTSVNSVVVDDFAKITLSLSSPIQNGQTVTLSYTKNSSNIKDLSGNDIASFVDFSVQNNTPAATSATMSSGGSTSGGSGGGGGGYTAFVTTSNNASTTKSVVTTKNTVRANNVSNASSSISLEPNVNETCDAYLIGTMRLGDKNNAEEVLKLQKFLNEFEGENLTMSGLYDSATFQAIVRFQEKYKKHVLLPWGLTRGTGVVSQTTRAKINALVCGKTYGCPYFTEYYRAGALGSEVDKIKSFLNLLNPAAKLNVNSSTYDTKMRLQVISFQNRYKNTVLKPWGLNYATSNWFKTSVSSANEIMGCSI